MKFKTKKGELSDMFIFVIIIFILAIGFFIIMYAINPITTGLRTAGINNSAEGENALQHLEGFGSMINNGFLLIFACLIMSTLITSFFVRTHPIFLFLYIIFLGITVILGVYLGNTFYDIQNNSIFTTTTSSATYLVFVMNHIVEITVAVGALSMIIVFAKFSTYGGTQQF